MKRIVIEGFVLDQAKMLARLLTQRATLAGQPKTYTAVDGIGLAVSLKIEDLETRMNDYCNRACGAAGPH